jgi:hypothetical protein
MTRTFAGFMPFYAYEPRYPMDRDAATAERLRTLEAENAALRRQLRGNPEPAVEWCEYDPQSVSGGAS